MTLDIPTEKARLLALADAADPIRPNHVNDGFSTFCSLHRCLPKCKVEANKALCEGTATGRVACYDTVLEFKGTKMTEAEARSLACKHYIEPWTAYDAEAVLGYLAALRDMGAIKP